MAETWWIGAVANGVIALAYFAIAGLLMINLHRTRQWLSNPLAAATAFVFFTCAGGHAIYGLQVAEAMLGSTSAAAVGAREMYGSAHMWGWDALTAIVGVLYLTMRRKFPDLVRGAALYEDLRVRQRRAMEINDNVVQGIVLARLNFDLARDDDGQRALHETLSASARIADEIATSPPRDA